MPICKEKHAMLQTLGKTLGGALAVLCLVSTLAVATERTCTRTDGKGSCTVAVGTDGKEVIVDGPGVKVGARVVCDDRSYLIYCTQQ
jgi:hypothetical protein